jgi:hypothetical protein
LKVGSTFEDSGLGLWITPIASNTFGNDRWIDVAISKTRPANLPAPQAGAGHLLTGRVVDTSGKPIAGALIHNGRLPRNYDYASANSDANGNYSLAMSATGTYVPGIYLYGYRLISPAPNASASVPGSMDFVLEALPRVSVTGANSVVEGQSATFTLTRTGSTAEPLPIRYQFTGNTDVADFQQSVEVTIPAGQNSVQINVPITADSNDEAAELLTLHVINPSQFQRDGVMYCYPGWELRAIGDVTSWYQTDPPYVTFADSAATISIIDGNSLRLALTAQDGLDLFGPLGSKFQIEISSDLRSWNLFASGTIEHSPTVVPVPPTVGNAPRFYRGRLAP